VTYTAAEQKVRYYANLEENRRKHREYARKNSDKYNAARREQRAADPEKARARDRARNRKPNPAASARGMHGPWIEEDKAAMWASQDGQCYLCGEPMIPGKEDVDHDHACCPKGKSCRICRRGLAHHRCNVVIGWAQDDPARLRRIAASLEAAQQAFKQRQAASGSGEQFTLFT
jgi:Recombination endonuclease VII